MDVPRQQATYLDLFTIYELHNLVSGKLWKLIGKKKIIIVYSAKGI